MTGSPENKSLEVAGIEPWTSHFRANGANLKINTQAHPHPGFV